MRKSLRSTRREASGTLIIALTVDDMNALLRRLDKIITGLPDTANTIERVSRR